MIAKLTSDLERQMKYVGIDRYAQTVVESICMMNMGKLTNLLLLKIIFGTWAMLTKRIE